MPGSPVRRRHPGLRLAVGGALLVHLGLVALWVVTVPLFATGDESAHVGYASAVAEARLPFVQSERVNDFPELGQAGRRHYVSNHPPAYHAVVAPLVVAADDSDHPRVFLLLARGVSAVMGVMAVAFVALTARELFSSSRARAVAAVVAVAVCGPLPAVVASSSAIRNDPLAVLAVTAVGWLLARALRLGLRRPTLLALGALCAVGMATRVAFLPVWLLCLGAVVGLGVWPGLRWARPAGAGIGRGLQAGLVVLLVPLLGAGWFYGLSLRRYGDLTGGSVVYPFVADRPWVPGAEDGMVGFLLTPSTWWSQLRQVGGAPPALNPDVHAAHGLLGLLVLGLFVASAVAGLRRRGTPSAVSLHPPAPLLDASARCTLAGMVLIGAATVAELASHVTHKGVDTQRYLLNAIGLWGTAWAVAAAAAPRRWVAPGLTLVSALLATGAILHAADTIDGKTRAAGGSWFRLLSEGAGLAGFPAAEACVVLLLAVVGAGLVAQLVGLRCVCAAEPERTEDGSLPTAAHGGT